MADETLVSAENPSNPNELSAAERERYARHLQLAIIGEEGQQKLKASKVLCLGVGGLGSPVAMYLAAAGVGCLGLVDADVVERSNLQRQLLHGESDIGDSKLASAMRRLKEINPLIEVRPYAVRFSAENAREIAEGYDLIVDGTDNFATRYLSNDLAYFLKIPNIYGAIYQFEGQVAVFAPHLGGPCYRCMFPQPPEPGMVPSCGEAGVLGVLPGIIGSLQAMEAIKCLLGLGRSPLDRLIHYDALQMRFREFPLRKDPQCPLCGEHPQVMDLIDYDEFCGLGKALMKTEITVEELQKLLQSGESIALLDVRNDDEYARAHLPEAQHLPLGELAERLAELPKARPLYIHCKAGGRSARAIAYLESQGYTDLVNVAGGLDAWRQIIDPTLPPA